MAVARAQGQGGFTAIHVWLIVFVFLWLTSTVLLVILYLEQDDLKGAAEQARTDYAKAVGSADKGLPQWAEARPGAGSTMAGLLESARAATAELISGTPGDPVSKLRADFDETVDTIAQNPFIVESGTPVASSSYAAALDDMYRRYLASAEALAEARKGVAEMTAELERVRGMQTGQREEFTAQGDALRDEVQKLRAEYDESRAEHAEQVRKFEREIEEIQRQCSDDIQQQRALTADWRDDYEDLFARFEQLKGKLGQSQVAPIELGTARRGDGEIVQARPGEDVVYINLGRGDHLTLGLEFAVYDKLAGIPEDGRAKARIEVVQINDLSAECQVVEYLTNEMIAAGDIVANPIYDRNRALKFFVMGDFDLDGDGRGDRDGPERIAAIVEEAGGELQPRLNAQVDFVVLGGPPPAPRRNAEYEESEDREYLKGKQAYDAYESQLASVRALAVPPLTQSVFLNFLGRDRTVVEDPLSALQAQASGR